MYSATDQNQNQNTIPQFRDQLSAQLDKYLEINGPNHIANLVAEIGSRLDIKDNNEDETNLSLATLLKDAKCRAGELNRVEALFLVRRIPVFEPLPGPIGNFACINQAMNFCTNILVSLGKPPADVVDRFNLLNTQLSDDQIAGVLGLYVVGLLHAMIQFRLNTQIRSYGFDRETVELLIDSYNRRSASQRKNPNEPGELRKGVVLTPLASSAPDGKNRSIVHEGGDGLKAIVHYRNYIPSVIDMASIEPLYRHMDGKIFKETFRISYPEWIDIYRVLNAIIADHLVSQSRIQTRMRMDKQQFLGIVEREDDFTQGGVAIVNRMSLEHHIYASRLHLIPPAEFDAANVEKFFKTHTRMNSEDFDEFVETHHCFYELDDERVILDYVRLASLLPVMRRIMTPLIGKSGKSTSKGKSFEVFVYDQVVKNLQNAKDVKLTVKRRVDNLDAFEADVAFVIEDILFVLDAKYHTKTRAYLSSSRNNVSSRMSKTLELLGYLDQQVNKNIDWLVDQWPEQTIKRVIPIVCTEEPEFLGSDDKTMWLEFPNIPRACTLDEILTISKQPQWLSKITSGITVPA